MDYLPRAVDAALTSTLESMGGVVVEGARGCGKTSTALQQAQSSIRLDTSPELVQLAQLNPSALLQGKTPRLIDEWQLAPNLWNLIRHEIDDRASRGQFILSGSATPAEDITRHSGVGRMGHVRMRPMALSESRPGTAQISLAELPKLKQLSAHSDLTYEDMAAQAVRGGWPGLLNASTKAAIIFNRSYCTDLAATEIPDNTGVRHDAVRIKRLLQAIARNLAGEATLAKLASDVGGSSTPADVHTIRNYMDALTRVFALDELPAWSVALRSKSRLRTSNKLHLADPSLACAALGVSPDRLARDPEYFGQVFESMVVRDLRNFASAQFGQVYHYRDNTNLEVDTIIEYPTGVWGAIEVKLGSAHIPEAEKNLLKLRDERVDLKRVGAPAFLAVVTATEYAYTLPSGIHVIPLAVLGA